MGVLLLMAFSLSFTACNNDDDDDNTMPVLAAVDQDFMRNARLGNNAEVKTSQLALARSQDSVARGHAQMMIAEHNAANRSLDSLARLRNVTLPDTSQLDTMARNMYNRLVTLRDSANTTTGTTDVSRAAFTREYVLGQIDSHVKSQNLYQAYLNAGQDAGVKTYANRILPRVVAHRQMAETLAQQRGFRR